MKDPNVSNLFVKIAPPDKKDSTVVIFNGEMDKIGLESVRSQVDETIEGLKTKYLVFDFEDLEFINSESIGYLLTVHYRLVKKEKELVLVNVSDHIADVLDVIGLLQLIKHYKTLKEFEDTLSG